MPPKPACGFSVARIASPAVPSVTVASPGSTAPHTQHAAILVACSQTQRRTCSEARLVGHGRTDRSHLRTRCRGLAEHLGIQTKLFQQGVVPIGTAYVPHAVKDGAAQVGEEAVGTKGAQDEILVLHESRRLLQQFGLVLAHPEELGDDPRGSQRQTAFAVVLLIRDDLPQFRHFLGRASVLPGEHGPDGAPVGSHRAGDGTLGGKAD